MELILSFIIWMAILGFALMFAQIILGVFLWILIGAAYLITLPFRLIYNYIKER